MRPSKDIAITFASRQTPDSRFSHFEGTASELVQMVRDNIDVAYRGKRSGVYHVPVPATKFKTGIVQLSGGEELKGKYESRQEGEDPRKWVATSSREKIPAKFCEVILYHRTVLEETQGYQAVADWEIISINASPTLEASPIPPDALIANHYGLSGGSKTNMSPEEFEAALKESVMWWKDKVMCG